MIPHHLLALGGTVTGLAGTLAAAAEGDPMGIGPYVGGGAGVIAVAALGEVTRRLLNGTLVPRVTRETEAELSANIVAAGQREARVMQLAEDSAGMVVNVARELKLHTEKTAGDLAAVTARQADLVAARMDALARAVEDLRDELREMRRGGQR